MSSTTTTVKPTCLFESGNISAKIKCNAFLKGNAVSRSGPRSSLVSRSNISAQATANIPLAKKIINTSKFSGTNKDSLSLSAKLIVKNKVLAKVSGDVISSSIVNSNSSFRVKYADKISGDIDAIRKFDEFNPIQKLYPVSDIITSVGDNSFLNEKNNPNSLHSSIDEGVCIGPFYKNFAESSQVSNDNTFIYPSALYTDGSFRYECQVTTPLSTPLESFLFIRAAAPVTNYSSKTPPVYKLRNILLKDPYDKTIIRYNDIDIIGDSDYYKASESNFTTYILKPSLNNCYKASDDPDFPSFGIESLPYKLGFDLEIHCNQYAFSPNFGEGYQYESCDKNITTIGSNDYLAHDGSPFATQSLAHHINPSPHIRISSIEIANSGSSVGFSLRNFLNLSTAVDEAGLRLKRDILPNQIKSTSYQNDIYPTGYETVWTSYDGNINSTNDDQSSELVKILRSNRIDEYINLSYSEIKDSGKLILRFSHEPPKPSYKYINGEFSIGYNNKGNKKEFNYAGLAEIRESDSYFDIDEIYLRVIAKKDILSPDYTIDVVGYSDDRILFVTPSQGGFLQNIEGVGSIPQISGYLSTDEFAIAAESISDKGDIYHKPASVSEGGDHYLVAEYADVAQSTKINSTSFQEYFIPLKIYENSLNNANHNCSLSSYFESLYLDICPIPSGASISHISLVAFYKPSNAINLYTLGHEDFIIEGANGTLFPSPRNEGEYSFNHGPSYGPISKIENIPHGYGFDATLKTNYSRRWRNVDGLVAVGPFNYDEFGYGFENPQLPKPFFGGYFSFNDDVGNDIISDDMRDLSTIQGSYIGHYDKIRNIGLRFKTDSLFSDPTPHTTIDWTRISGYESDPLFGKIADSFDNAVRVSGDYGYLSFPHFDIDEGFAIFFRFSPDIDMSGINHNYYNSGTLFSMYNEGAELEFALGYKDGFLTAYATDDQGASITIQDSKHYDEYSYPLSVVLTYNNGQDGKLTLYTDNEYDSYNFERKRSESSSFNITSGAGELTFGYSLGSGVGFNGFITDIAVSAPSTQTFDVPLLFNVESFIDGIHNKYWDVAEDYSQDTTKSWSFVDKELSKWKLGSFNMCHFSPAFSKFTERFGQDFIYHRVKSDGIAYSAQSDISLPNSINADVSYHTQIENDMIRFQLAPKGYSFIYDPNSFYAVQPRIVNKLIKGYTVLNEAFLVDTVLEHITHNDIVWDNGKIGPKLIVSLYTPSKDNPSKPYHNPGLINRFTHYLKPSGCIHKITSLFDLSSLYNEDSEGWSDFDQTLNSSELTEKFFFDDVQKMFLQYDIIYPTGLPYDSTINILGTNVTLTEALHKARPINNLG